MKHHRQWLNAWICAAVLSLGSMAPVVMSAPEAQAQSVELNTRTTSIYAEMPFTLSVTVSDFDSEPEPTIDEFEIKDATVELLNVIPQKSSMTQIINGHITSKTEVTFVYNYQITPSKAGVYLIPALHVHQGTKEASSHPVNFTATEVGTSRHMKIELQFPERKFWVGETFEASLIWYLRRNVGSQDFDIPVLKMPDTFDVTEPENVRGQAITLMVGSRQISFPFTRDEVMRDGVEYTRFVIPLKLTPLKSGVLEIPASKVIAEIEDGTTADMWGFPRASYTRAKAEDKIRTCTVQELPQSSRPATYSNAMGSDYSISVSADRTIVKAGDPIILTIDISSPNLMDGLILPSLVSAGLNEQLFGVSDEEPVGENISGGTNRYIKRFNVPVRIKSERVSEVPPLAFSYFNPKTAEFTTVRSQPIALSVTAVDKISAADVITGRKDVAPSGEKPSGEKAKVQVEVQPIAEALELNLVSESASGGTGSVRLNSRPLRIGIYVMPFLVWIGLVLARKTRRRHQACEAQRAAALELKKVLDEAETMGAREASAAINNALNSFLTATETPRESFKDLCERMDVEAYRPDAGKISKDLVSEIRKAVPGHVNPVYAKLISSIFALLIAIAFLFVPGQGMAQSMEEGVSRASSVYHKAMEATERSDRISGFKLAYAQFKALSDANPESPGLLVDAGNAAYGASDLGHAVLCYKRALEIEPGMVQAQNNLVAIQSSLYEAPRESSQVIASTFFLNNAFSRDTRLLFAAILFALGILLCIPWHPKYRKVTCYIAVIPFVFWLWMLVGAFIEKESNEAVVMSEYYLKTADNPGASNVSSSPVEPGHTVEILREAESWTQVQTTRGVKGWLPSSSIEAVHR